MCFNVSYNVVVIFINIQGQSNHWATWLFIYFSRLDIFSSVLLISWWSLSRCPCDQNQHHCQNRIDLNLLKLNLHQFEGNVKGSPCQGHSLADMNRFLMKEEIGVPDQMIIVVRDMINDPYASLPPQRVQHEVHFWSPIQLLPLSKRLNFKEQKDTQISLWCKSCCLVLPIVD